MNRSTPARQLATFLARFSPEIVALAKAARARLRKRLPGAIEMVYDIRTLVSEAIAFGETPFSGRGRIVIRAICRKQRPRR